MSFFNRLFATKSLERLNKEMQEDDGRLRRVLYSATHGRGIWSLDLSSD